MLLASIFMMSMIAVATQQANALEAPLVMIENFREFDLVHVHRVGSSSCHKPMESIANM
jgi:hypothetical protein